jgi:hypothetical protein
MIRLQLTAAIGLLGACTHYGTTVNYGPRNEVARRLIGSPQVEEVTSSNLSAGFGGASVDNGFGTTVAAGNLEGSSGTVKRTHCVQQAQVDYVQPFDVVPQVQHRGYDVAGSIVLGVVGLSIIGAGAQSYSMAQSNYNSDLQFYQSNPSFFPMPTEPTPPTAAYVVGTGALIGAAGWMIYSLTQLPKGTPPSVARQNRTWTETTYVEAQGCGLVPADRPFPTPSPASIPPM